ncbi:helix-turn-helix transcriptional regulator [Pseudoflavitalea sp. G-6-1-2]|uniref:winged helix-turn-helix transcriptional regulator n=1 Tax=Pseudoflavitalea sp. G-6-1-2 TaxID=2728841 RepID=UPI00146C8A25|nr:helix-turn-helix domain-containing protein [Pseudoflavitalea sp. G-6-1-2]NML23918.1 helix-turn-helix transcriptional regulator [Pseudoflavitalea sp. G-6-1-2]
MKAASIEECTRSLLPIRDVLDILGGKWKLQILMLLMFEKRRFKDLQNHIHGITPKMLARVLRELEMNQLIDRTVYDESTFYIEYSITQYGLSLKKVILELESWGKEHRKRILVKTA